MSEDIRQDAEVVKTYWEMGGHKKPYCANCSSGSWLASGQSNGRSICKTCCYGPPITMSLGDLAFWMRDKCFEASIGGRATNWPLKVKELSNDFDDRGLAFLETLAHATPEQWIRAAVKAWRSK